MNVFSQGATLVCSFNGIGPHFLSWLNTSPLFEPPTKRAYASSIQYHGCRSWACNWEAKWLSFIQSSRWINTKCQRRRITSSSKDTAWKNSQFQRLHGEHYSLPSIDVMYLISFTANLLLRNKMGFRCICCRFLCQHWCWNCKHLDNTRNEFIR